jgi:CheY-like chemotaxis protein
VQIITDLSEAKGFVKNMSQSMADRAYWEDWYAIDITATPPLDWIKQAKITALLRTRLPRSDSTVAWLERSILVIFKKGAGFATEGLLEELTEASRIPNLLAQLLCVAAEPEQMKQLFARLQWNDTSSLQIPVVNYRFLKALVPNVEDLLHDWHQDKHKREGREQPHIMIVDDDLMTLKIVGAALEKNYVVITAQNGAEALAKHLQLMPDIIFLDIGLPDCDGITLLNYMQQYDQDCRIVMFSADDFVKTRAKAFAGGAKGFLPKPFNLGSFQEHIAQWFSSKKAR